MDTTMTENDAKLFRKGIKCECDGKKEIANEEIVSCCTDNYEYSNESEDLSLRFLRLIGPQICSPGYFQTATHFSVLPFELVLYIFRWVVSEDMDLRMLDQCAAVCRGWYVTARDPELWCRACSKFWPSNINELAPYNNSWRIMFIERPNVLTTGCYICKLSLDEESFRDNTNRPSFANYRFLRFFSNGCVVMAVSSDRPEKIVRMLHTREKAPVDEHWGTYRSFGDQLYLSVTRTCFTFNMVMEISKYKSKHNWKLQCIDFQLSYLDDKSRSHSKTYNTSENLSPYIFSPVKCYTNESYYIL